MNEQPRWSLKQEVQKRKTQEILRTLDARMVQTPLPVTTHRTAVPTPVKPNHAPSPPPTALVAATSQQTTRTISAVHPSVRWTKRQKQIGIVATILLITVCLMTTVAVTNQPFTLSALPALPASSSHDFVGYLQKAGVLVTSLRPFMVPNDLWSAGEEIQLEVYRGNDKGTFVILSYTSAAQAGVDAFKATYAPKFKQWTLVQISNLLVLSSPDTPQSLKAEIAIHLAQYLVVPNRTFIPSVMSGG